MAAPASPISRFNAAAEIRMVAPLSMSPSFPPPTPASGAAANGGQGGGNEPGTPDMSRGGPTGGADGGVAEPTAGGTTPVPVSAAPPGSGPGPPDGAFCVYQAGGA